MDNQLISELIKNGRPKYSELVKKIGTSKSTISRRISSLIDDDTLKIVAVPNVSLDYLADAFMLISADFSQVDSVCDKLFSYPEAHIVMKLMNDYDILLTIQSSSREDLYKLITRKVASIDGVIKTETFLLANILHFNANALSRPIEK